MKELFIHVEVSMACRPHFSSRKVVFVYEECLLSEAFREFYLRQIAHSNGKILFPQRIVYQILYDAPPTLVIFSSRKSSVFCRGCVAQNVFIVDSAAKYLFYKYLVSKYSAKWKEFFQPCPASLKQSPLFNTLF